MDDGGPPEVRWRTTAGRRAGAGAPDLGHDHIVEILAVAPIAGIPEIDGVPSAVAFFDPRAESVTASSGRGGESPDVPRPDPPIRALLEMSGRDRLEALEAQEARLVFDRFDDDTAWELGSALRERGSAEGLPIAISVRRNGRLLFFAALPGSSADNEDWLARKCAVVDRYGRSSLRVGEQFRVDGKSFDEDSRLDPAHFAAHGGAFPILLRGTGCIGTVAVSGLPQLDDHQLVVDTLTVLVERSG